LKSDLVKSLDFWGEWRRKTTTIRMLLNLFDATSGELTIFGLSYARHRSQILRSMNASSGTLTLPGKLSVVENLKVFADLYGMKSAKKRIDFLMNNSIHKLQNKSLYSLSTGQQVRVSWPKPSSTRRNFCCWMNPRASLDPDVADRVRSFLMQVVQRRGNHGVSYLAQHGGGGKNLHAYSFLNKEKYKWKARPAVGAAHQKLETFIKNKRTRIVRWK